VVDEDECVAVKVFDRPPKGTENLDRLCGKIEPLFSAEELARLRTQEEELWSQHLRNPKLLRVPNLSAALSLLASVKRRAPGNFREPATAEAIAQAARAMGVKIPRAWQKVLRLSNGGTIPKSPLADECSCFIVPTDKLAQSQREEVEYYRGIGSKLGKEFALAIRTEIGDSIWLDTTRTNKDGDCRVVLVSHETGEEEREWASVAEFLEELVLESAD
jgi:hypothetical protein